MLFMKNSALLLLSLCLLFTIHTFSKLCRINLAELQLVPCALVLENNIKPTPCYNGPENIQLLSYHYYLNFLNSSISLFKCLAKPKLRIFSQHNTMPVDRKVKKRYFRTSSKRIWTIRWKVDMMKSPNPISTLNLNPTFKKL